jgi:hypothetical protein
MASEDREALLGLLNRIESLKPVAGPKAAICRELTAKLASYLEGEWQGVQAPARAQTRQPLAPEVVPADPASTTSYPGLHRY